MHSSLPSPRPDSGADLPAPTDRTAATVPALRFSTAQAGSPGTQDWRGVAAVLFDAARPGFGPAGTLCAELTIHHLGPVLLLHAAGGAMRYRRSTEQARRDDLDHYLVHLPLRGRGIYLKGSDAAPLRPMDVGMVDLACPFDLLCAAGEGVGLIVPRPLLAPLLTDPDRQHGRVVPRENPLGRLLGRHVAALHGEAERLGLHEASAMAQATIGLIAIALAAAGSGAAGPAAPGRNRQSYAVRAFIERSLHRAELSPDLLADELHLSRSTLYRLFERYGGVRHYIRRRRLHRALLEISSPLAARRRIGDIAYDLGFADEAHFSRVFSAAFGLSPRAARTAAQRGDGGPLATLIETGSGPQQLAGWLRGLVAG